MKKTKTRVKKNYQFQIEIAVFAGIYCLPIDLGHLDIFRKVLLRLFECFKNEV